MLVLMDVFGIKEAMSDFWRYVCMSIDNVVYWFVEVILQLIMDLSKVEIFTQTTINTFTKRIYIILGLVMVFKIMISFIQILIDPDTLTDKEKGAGSVLKRVVISLVLIVLVPSIFSTARKIQTYVLPIIPRVIMGVTAEDDGDGITTESKIGKLMAWYSFLPFFDYAGTCNDGSIKSYDDTDNTSSSNVEISSVSEAFANINRKDKSCGEGDYHYVYNHKIIVSTIVGAYLVYTLVTVAVQVAVRAIKFGICEFIAPIPIASYIDPKTSKQTFDKWVSTSIKVYLDLFIQLIVVYFVAFIFQTYFADGNNFKIIVENTGGSFWRATLVILFMIVGLLSFVKQFPKFLSDLLGLNTSGDMANIFKGAGWKQVGGTLAAPASMVSSGLSAFRYSRKHGENGIRGGIKTAGSTLGAMLRAGKSSFGAAINGKGPGEVFDTRRGVQAITEQKINTRANQLLDQKRYDEAWLPEKYKNKIENNKNEMARQRNRYNNAALINDTTVMQDALQRIDALKAERRVIDDNLKNYRRKAKENGDLAPPAGSLRAKISDTWNDFSGNPVPDSKTYHAAAGFMNEGKAIFNEAKSKVAEKPTLIKDKLSLSYHDDVNKRDVSVSATYGDVFDAYRAMQEGRTINDARFQNLSRSTMETLYGDALKSAAAQYVNEVEKGNIDNENMKQKIGRWQVRLENEINISKGDRSEVTGKIKEFITNDGKEIKLHGDLFKGADNIGERFETKSTQLAATEAAKKGSNN